MEEMVKICANIVANNIVKINEEEIFELLKIRRRWPKESIEVISAFGHQSDDFFEKNEGCLIFDKWIELHYAGFTTMLNSIFDLTSDLRHLEQELYIATGKRSTANIYLSNGTTNPAQRVSFDEHTHPYNVIVLPLYGNADWKVNGNKFTCNPGEVIVIPANTPHAVVANTEKRASLTINLA